MLIRPSFQWHRYLIFLFPSIFFFFFLPYISWLRYQDDLLQCMPGSVAMQLNLSIYSSQLHLILLQIRAKTQKQRTEFAKQTGNLPQISAFIALQHRAPLLLPVLLHYTYNVLNYCVDLWPKPLQYKCIRKGNCWLCDRIANPKWLHSWSSYWIDYFLCVCNPSFRPTGKADCV